MGRVLSEALPPPHPPRVSFAPPGPTALIPVAHLDVTGHTRNSQKKIGGQSECLFEHRESPLLYQGALPHVRLVQGRQRPLW